MIIIVTKPVSGFTVGKKYTVTQRNPLNYLALSNNNTWEYIPKENCTVEKK